MARLRSKRGGTGGEAMGRRGGGRKGVRMRSERMGGKK